MLPSRTAIRARIVGIAASLERVLCRDELRGGRDKVFEGHLLHGMP